MLESELLTDLAGAEALAPEWDRLSCAQALPLCAPGWMLAWWRHIAPERSELRIVALRKGGQLVALAPWFAHRGHGSRLDIRFLGAELSDRVDVLCVPGHEREVASALREAILAMRPRPHLVAFEAVPASSHWARSLASGRSGRLHLSGYRNSLIPAPTVALAQHAPDGPESWLMGRSSNFRSQMRRMRRRLAAQGGGVRQILDPDEVEPAIDALLRMHAARWEGRGVSSLGRPEIRAMLAEAAGALGPDRLRLWAAEIDGELISVQLFLAAGGEIKYWNGGWLERYAELKPTMLTILAALEDGIARGEQRLDLGAGTHPYKLRFADGEDPLSWGGLIVRGSRWPRTRAEMTPQVMRFRAKRLVQALPEPVGERVAGALRGGRTGVERPSDG